MLEMYADPSLFLLRTAQNNELGLGKPRAQVLLGLRGRRGRPDVRGQEHHRVPARRSLRPRPRAGPSRKQSWLPVTGIFRSPSMLMAYGLPLGATEEQTQFAAASRDKVKRNLMRALRAGDWRSSPPLA